MKKITLIMMLGFMLNACFPVQQVIKSSNEKVLISNGNFNNLGTYYGTVVKSNYKFSLNRENGLIEDAKEELLKQARERGVELSGTRVLTNVSTDIIRNWKQTSITMCADIIEFTN